MSAGRPGPAALPSRPPPHRTPEAGNGLRGGKAGVPSRPPSLTSCSFRAVRVASSRCSLPWAARGCAPPPAGGRCGMSRAARTSSRCFSRSTWSSWRPARAACSLSPTRPRSQPPARGAPSSIVNAGPRHRPWQRGGGGGGEAAGLLPLRAVPAVRAARPAPRPAAERVRRGRGGPCGFGGEVGTGEGRKRRGLRLRAAPGPPPGEVERNRRPRVPSAPRGGGPCPGRGGAGWGGAALASSLAPAVGTGAVPAVPGARVPIPGARVPVPAGSGPRGRRGGGSRPLAVLRTKMRGEDAGRRELAGTMSAGQNGGLGTPSLPLTADVSRKAGTPRLAFQKPTEMGPNRTSLLSRTESLSVVALEARQRPVLRGQAVAQPPPRPPKVI